MDRPPSKDLAHFGVKGMKWGIRKRDQVLNSRVGKVAVKVDSKINSADAKSAKKSKSQAKLIGSDSLSNKELQALVNRMQLEQQYTALAKKPRPARGIAIQFVGDILKNVGTNVFTTLAETFITGRAGRRRGPGTNSYDFGTPQPNYLALAGQVRKAIEG